MVKTCLGMQVDPVNSCCLWLVWVKFWSQLSWSYEFSIFFMCPLCLLELWNLCLLIPCLVARNLICFLFRSLSNPVSKTSLTLKCLHVCVCVCVCELPRKYAKIDESFAPKCSHKFIKKKRASSLRGFIIFLNLV